jgi:L-amino acid N-acyltransferase
LQEVMGFQRVGHFKEIGFKFDQWLDVVFMQMMLSGPLPSAQSGEGVDSM